MNIGLVLKISRDLINKISTIPIIPTYNMISYDKTNLYTNVSKDAIIETFKNNLKPQINFKFNFRTDTTTASLIKTILNLMMYFTNKTTGNDRLPLIKLSCRDILKWERKWMYYAWQKSFTKSDTLTTANVCLMESVEQYLTNIHPSLKFSMERQITASTN